MPTSDWYAFGWGCLSAVSLPLGAWAGLRWSPHSKVVSTLMAFGAGALLFALTIELLGKLPELSEELGLSVLIAGVCGAVSGGLIFDLLNQLLNNRGAFLRNLSNIKEYVARTKRRRARRVLRRLSRLDAFADVPPEALASLVSRIKRRSLTPGERIFAPGDPVDEIHFVRRGRVRVSGPAGNGQGNTEFLVGPSDDVGALPVLTHWPASTSAVAESDVVLYVLEDDDLRHAAASSPALRLALEALARDRAADWAYGEADPGLAFLHREADEDLGEMNMPLEDADYHEERSQMRSAAGVGMAIWLGIAIDAVPESLVIGTLASSSGGISLAFIAGVFLANFPEAMSSAVSMRSAGFARRRIMLMWGSLCLLTGVGAWLGALLLSTTHGGSLSMTVIFIEGLAAGAMLAAIAETMLPEAFEQGGSIVGMATLSGFLTALVIASI